MKNTPDVQSFGWRDLFVVIYSCTEGFYYNKITQICEKCDLKCKTCRDDSFDCIECGIYRDNPPTCSCSEYLLQNACLKICPFGF